VHHGGEGFCAVLGRGREAEVSERRAEEQPQPIREVHNRGEGFCAVLGRGREGEESEQRTEEQLYPQSFESF